MSKNKNIIKQRREEAGLSQSQLAELCGVNFRTLQDYEQGHKSIASARADILCRISSALDCTMEEILAETGQSDDFGRVNRLYRYASLLNRALDSAQGKVVGTPFDDVFRTLAVDCSQLLIPVVNLAFGEDYEASAKVEPGQNEHLADRDSGENSRIVTDSNFVVLERNGERKSYQIECQSRADSSILLRLFEYATAIALEGGEISARKVTIAYPRSALIYLRHTKNTPDRMEVELQTPGGTVKWDVPVLKAGIYSIDDIFAKHLYILIPFYLLTHEKELRRMETDEATRKELRREYEEIFSRMEKALEEGYLNTHQLVTIRNLSKTICEHLTGKYAGVRKELMEVMGGKVLEYEAKDILNRGISQGISQGISRGIQAVIDTCKRLGADFDMTAENLREQFHLSDAEVQDSMKKYW